MIGCVSFYFIRRKLLSFKLVVGNSICLCLLPKEFSLTGKELDDTKKKDLKPGNTALLAAEKPNSKKDLITRRYKVFLSDLEKAMVYSLSHEVNLFLANHFLAF